MTVRMLVSFNGYFEGQIVNLGAVEEARLIGLGFASADQNGPASDESIAKIKSDPVTGEIDNISGPGGLYSGPKRQAQAPYKLASFGDSRANVNSSAPDVSGSLSSLSVTKGPVWTAAYRKDTELVANYGVSGDLASGWSAAARTGGKTVASFVAFGVDLVHIQYGVNDIFTGNGTTPTAATICDSLKAVVFEALKSGIAVAFESVLPCTAAGWVSAGSGTAAQKQAIADSVNTTMQLFIASLPQAVFIDTATQLKDGTGYANTAYYIDQIHLNNIRGMLSGKLVAHASLAILPKKVATYFPSGLQTGANFVDSIAPPVTTILSGVAGTFALNSQTISADSQGPYVEFNITALTLSSGEATFWAAIGGDVGGFGATAKYAVAVSDVLQGQCRLVIDDGSGGRPSGLRNFVMRQRCYYQAGGGVYADFGSYAVPSGMAEVLEPVNILATAPRVTTTVASSGIEPPTHAKGYALHLFVSIAQTTAPVRIRVYAPSLRKSA